MVSDMVCELQQKQNVIDDPAGREKEQRNHRPPALESFLIRPISLLFILFLGRGG